jgi:hypothetical protein
VFIILILHINPVLGQSRTAGVSSGDAFTYTWAFDIDVDNNDVYPSDIFTGLLEEVKAIEWTEITVLDVVGTQVSAQVIMHYKNGTEQTQIQSMDIETGRGNLTNFLIASNLSANDSVYVGQDQSIINETVVRSFASGARQQNLQTITMEYSLSGDEASAFNMTDFQQTNTAEILWDKELGILTEMTYNMTTKSQNMNANISAEIKLVESNAIVVAEFPTFIMIILATAVTLTILSMKTRRTTSY